MVNGWCHRLLLYPGSWMVSTNSYMKSQIIETIICDEMILESRHKVWSLMSDHRCAIPQIQSLLLYKDHVAATRHSSGRFSLTLIPFLATDVDQTMWIRTGSLKQAISAPLDVTKHIYVVITLLTI